MIEDPITLMAVVVMIFTHVWIAIMARDDSRAKGFEALLLLCCPPFALFYYLRMPKRKKKYFIRMTRRKRNGIDCLLWIFLASTAVVIYRLT